MTSPPECSRVPSRAHRAKEAILRSNMIQEFAAVAARHFLRLGAEQLLATILAPGPIRDLVAASVVLAGQQAIAHTRRRLTASGTSVGRPRLRPSRLPRTSTQLEAPDRRLPQEAAKL